MRRTDTQLARARKDAYAQDPTTTSGIAHNTLLEFINDGQDIMQSLISAAWAKFNVTEEIQNCVVDQEPYEISDRVFLNNRFISQELSPTGNLQDYYSLEKKDFYERDTSTGIPTKYIRRGASTLLNPIPDSTVYTLRTNYEREVDDLDIRRGRVASVVGAGTSGSPLTSIVLEATLPTPDGTDTSLADIAPGDYVCVVDLDGVRQSRNIPVTAYSSLTLTVTSFVMATGDTLPAAGDYVVIGKYMTTHSQLPDMCDNYLVAYTTWRILSHKGSTKVSERYSRIVSTREAEIVKAYATIGQELLVLPEIGDGLEI